MKANGPAGHLILTCEHAGNKIPAAYARLFRGADDVLASHRGWDPGALTLARLLAKRLRRPLLSVSWSRLFVEANRASHNPRIWSAFTKVLPKSERDAILERYWRPHRTAVEDAVAAAARHRRVVHVAVHSFTPVLDGEVRNADIAFLYDSRRKSEAALCRRWAEILRGLDPKLRIRHNYPYSGASDGLTTWLRKRHAEARYLGVEVELNQALVGSPGWRVFQDNVAASLAALMAADSRAREDSKLIAAERSAA